MPVETFKVSIPNPDRTEFPSDVCPELIGFYQSLVSFARQHPGHPLDFAAVTRHGPANQMDLATCIAELARHHLLEVTPLEPAQQ